MDTITSLNMYSPLRVLNIGPTIVRAREVLASLVVQKKKHIPKCLNTTITNVHRGKERPVFYWSASMFTSGRLHPSGTFLVILCRPESCSAFYPRDFPNGLSTAVYVVSSSNPVCLPYCKVNTATARLSICDDLGFNKGKLRNR